MNAKPNGELLNRGDSGWNSLVLKTIFLYNYGTSKEDWIIQESENTLN